MAYVWLLKYEKIACGLEDYRFSGDGAEETGQATK